MSKREDFLWIVQAIMIKHNDNIVGWSGVAGDAVAASYCIPANMTARDAALGFCGAKIRGFGATQEVPEWMADLQDPL
ncbi:hypothetical protein [Thioclava sp. GXIMD4215]|uniref:hypothetical protein n=1 Tax=Thioclava sp. GXIMD4215 TaxID=3131928 RepID=UPI00324A230F